MAVHPRVLEVSTPPVHFANACLWVQFGHRDLRRSLLLEIEATYLDMEFPGFNGDRFF